jgi:hypothetical protein
VIAKQINYGGHIEFLNNKVEATTCIEAFSDNKKKITKQPRTLGKRSLRGNPRNDKKRKGRRDSAYGQL